MNKKLISSHKKGREGTTSPLSCRSSACWRPG